MRPIHFLLALALAISSISASAADVDFELGSALFEKLPTSRPNPFRLSATEEKRSYGHPIYEELWPMTLAAFQETDSDDEPDSEFNFPIRGVLEKPFLLAANDAHPLRKSLWKATREKFEELEAVHVFGGIAFMR